MLCIHSLRARFVIIVIMAVLMLLGVSRYAQQLVETNTINSHQNINHYYNSHRVLRNAERALLELERKLQNDMFTNEIKNERKLFHALANFEDKIKQVALEPVIKQKIFSGLIPSLQDLTKQLNNNIHYQIKGDNSESQETIAGLKKIFHLIERRFYDAIISNTFNSLNASDTLNSIIWFLVFGAFIVLMLAYLFFELSIRRPLMLVAKALKTEGEGGVVTAKHLQPKTIEIRFLIDAFNSMRQQVYRRQQKLHSVLESASDGIITFDWTGKIESINTAGEDLFFIKRDQVIGQNISKIIPIQSFSLFTSIAAEELFSTFVEYQGEELETSVERNDGTSFQLSLKLSEFSIAGYRYFNALVSDISERKEFIDKLTFLAQQDPLTGLFNRHRFFEELQKSFNMHERDKNISIALISIDLDRFKHINDSMGHQAGDILLKNVANIITQRCRCTDILARLGGDEFMILLQGTVPLNATKAAEGIRLALADYPFSYAGKTAGIGCSIGVAILENDVTAIEELIAHSDLAMRMAKQAGRNRVCLFSDLDLQTQNNMQDIVNYSSLIDEILKNNLIYPVFQAIVEVGSAKIVGYEMLARLKLQSDMAQVSIAHLISTAERLGKAVEIDRKMLNILADSLLHVEHWPKNKRLSFNLSAQSIGDEQIISTIKDITSNSILPHGCLICELTETAAVTSLPATQVFLQDLSKLGCKAALDDFGTGYSSFGYLRELSFDYIKLDREYIDGIHKDPLDSAMIKAIHSVAQVLGAKTIAEGVEHSADYQELQNIGIDFAQGYLFAHPVANPPWKISVKQKDNQYKDMQTAYPSIQTA